jgi:hypothetical protein
MVILNLLALKSHVLVASTSETMLSMKAICNLKFCFKKEFLLPEYVRIMIVLPLQKIVSFV